MLLDQHRILPMKFVKWFIIAVAAILGIFVAITYFLPRDYYIERSIEIDAPAFLVFANVVDLEAWQTWNPWNQMDPDLKITYGDRKVGAGASYSWSSDVIGGGTMHIVEATAPLQVKYKLVFAGYEDNPGYSDMILSADSATGPTLVTWTFEGDAGEKFFAAWMAVLMDKLLGPTYDKGLSSLKQKCEDQVKIPALMIQ